MSLLTCPNEILEEILSYLYNEQRKIYTWDNLVQSDTPNRFGSANEIAESTEQIEPRPGIKYLRMIKDRNQASFYDLRLLCRRFEAVATAFAFSTVYICGSLEHTQLITRKLVGTERDPFARYTRHVVISPMSLLPKDCSFPKSRCRLFNEAPKEESETQRIFNVENSSRWVKIFINEITSLFSNLPGLVTELTIRTLEPTRETEDNVGDVNELFLKAFSLATRSFPATQLRKLHIHAQNADSAAYLWRGFETIKDVVSYAGPSTYTCSQRPYLEKIKEVNVRGKSVSGRNMKHITEWLPETMEHLSIKSPYSYGAAYPPEFQLSNPQNLKSLVLEGIEKFDESVVFFLLTLETCSKLHIYGCDITNMHSWAGDITPIDLRWGHVFTAFAELPRLVDFQAGNLSYSTVRQTYKYLDLERIWFFTDYRDDFEAFSAFRTTLIERRRHLGLPQHTWLSKTSIYEDDSRSLKAYGLIAAIIADVFQHRRLVIRTKQDRRRDRTVFGEIKDNIVGKIEIKNGKVVYSLSGSWTTERQRGRNPDLLNTEPGWEYGDHTWEDI
ncbi:hypothetical protein AOL_s00043g207 [Orbilia oligospora ATCC 24927]|uniref:Uncharacterized protein n=1 Tax=Arthrobotrys oligospora (strain ATCC 24927 / CBS 115.81 / DSM 1491) TaxID=756982 RepID=G1X3D4_ARTOA|nr:hypothetical protein AOL_s00043g207 [Orbilia oligospora ATCC 24927]EGX52418.1 hypothetical protein AOL_s00043g207 [Orbilia oligospora ATCC 24927]